MKKLIFLFLIFHLSTFGQNNLEPTPDNVINKLSQKNKYLNFLLNPDSSSQNHLFTCSYQYLYTSTYSTFRTGGFILSGGINLARLVTKKLILGICFDIKGIKGFTSQKFSKTFVDDFNDNFILTYSNQHDSVRAYVVRDAINRNVRHFSGNYCGTIGIMISLFPQKYGGLLFIAKKGYRSFPIFNVSLQSEFGNDDHPSLYLSENYSFELSVKPYSFFKNSFIDQNKLEDFDWLKSLTFTAYYERINLKGADFYGVGLKQIVTSTFIDKYGLTENYGFKIGLSFY